MPKSGWCLAPGAWCLSGYPRNPLVIGSLRSRPRAFVVIFTPWGGLAPLVLVAVHHPGHPRHHGGTSKPSATIWAMLRSRSM